MAEAPVFSEADLMSICKVLADTDGGLTGAEIGRLLDTCKLADNSPQMTKWKRLFNAIAVAMNEKKRTTNCVVTVINTAMAPVQYAGRREVFDARRKNLNIVLAFSGLAVNEEGKVCKTAIAKTLDEAHARAGRLQAALRARQVHEDVIKYCQAELVRENCFHAVFEAMKSIADKMRRLSGTDGDGAELVDKALSSINGVPPLLAINALMTDSQRSEQRGFVNLLKGLFGTIRNPLAHNPKIEWPMSEQDALDIFSTLSLAHRKLDAAQKFTALP